MTIPSHRVRRTPQNTQYIYNLNRRIHDVKTYPVLSPQGATILLYAHDNGLTVVWRGGKRLKALESEKHGKAGAGKQNGAKDPEDAVMVLDSDDEAPPASADVTSQATKAAEFEERDSDADFPEIVQTLDLAFGVEILHVAIPPIAQCAAADTAFDILKEKMVFVVSSSTADVHVVTLPLTPPSHESKARPELRKDLLAGNAGKGKWGEVLISLNGQGRSSDALAITFDQRKRPNLERSRSLERKSSGAILARVIVAAHCREASGTLRLWDVNLDQKRNPSDRPIEPFQTEYLPHPLSSIAFNPSRTSQLLAIDPHQAVRIYDYSIASLTDDISEGPFPTQGSWLLSLYPPFTRGSTTSLSRKPIVAAAWISNGRAILALLADGQWGIWDVAGAGPAANSNGSGLLGKAASGIRGAALTTFSASGQLEGTSPLRNPATQKSGGEFVPMTPHTRRDVLASTFAGGLERLATIHGGIEVTQLPSSKPGASDESAVLWLGGADHIVSLIPSLGRYWESQARKSTGAGANIFGSQPTRMIRIADLHVGLTGEHCSGIGLVPKPRSHSKDEDDTHEHSGDLPVEIIVQGESRLVIVRESEEGLPSVASRLLATKKRKLGPAPAAEPVNAIIVHPAPNKPANVKFNLSIAKRGSLRAPRQTAKSQFQPDLTSFDKPARGDGAAAGADEKPYTDEVTMTQSMMHHPPQAPGTGLGFAEQLEDAADAEDDEEAAQERDVEEEILDIMEIDQVLEGMTDRNGGTTRNVFFEAD
ncbi:uncharacterized protein E0L32_002791 [Thyridium curvatum]|uniref:Nucleoporin NUP37 n=1 Tax=Thyridium curvatum TaxID=1093900 RepID=A0A507B7I3_9PEZI|nr:uncharacterized protein E0L32_002791 [Thyridium curvatum]TPX18282.1 hypothetical protein E0L32_002791 [Thyridium curvatum]